VVLKQYNKILLSTYKDNILGHFFRISLLGKMGNKIKKDELFEQLEKVDSNIIRFSINDFCFGHYSICTLIRSSLLGDIISERQNEWFQKHISENIWRLENPFSVKFFELEQKYFTRDFLVKLFKMYNFDLPSSYESINIINLKRIFFKKKIKSKKRSFLDIFYLYRLGDINKTYFNEI